MQTEPPETRDTGPDLYELVTKKADNIRNRWSEPLKPPVKAIPKKGKEKEREEKEEESKTA
jgi:hypothetical protein